jgi:hypothetical protein
MRRVGTGLAKLNLGKRACAVLALCAAAAIALPAQTFTTLHMFDAADGWYPSGGLVQGTDGNLYGTTLYGGTNTSCYATAVARSSKSPRAAR